MTEKILFLSESPEFNQPPPDVADSYIAFLDDAIRMLQPPDLFGTATSNRDEWFVLLNAASKDTLAAITVFVQANQDHPKIREIDYKIGLVIPLLKQRFNNSDSYKEFNKDVGKKIKWLRETPSDNSSAQKILDDFYANWAIVDDHGKTWVFHDDPKWQLSRRTIDQFRSFFMDIRIVKDDGTKRTKVPVTEIWLGDNGNGKRKYKNVLFDPSQAFDPKSDTLNLWRNFVVVPKEGDCHLMQEFVLNVICCGNSAHYNWLMAYYAHMIQRPWEKPGSAIVLRGIKRIGKSFFGRKLGELIDGPFDPLKDIKHYFPTENRNDLLGDFTGHLEHILLMQLEELVWARSHKDESKMKEVTTGETMSIRPMHSPSRIVKNYIRPLLISNADWAVPITWDESRYFVLEVSAAHKDDIPYFSAVDEEWHNGGREAWMHYLTHYNIVGYNLREAPRTKAATKQLVETLRGVDRWYYERLNQYDLPFVDFDMETGQPKLLRGAAYEDFCEWSNNVREGDRSDKTKFGAKLRELIPWIKDGWYTPEGIGSKQRLHAQIWPSLQECRDFWATKFLFSKRPDVWDDLTLNWNKKENIKEIAMGIKEFETNKDWLEFLKNWPKEEEKRVQELTIRYLN
jgi:hypothetical protein